ncbi:hypothetical protein M3Y98_00354300 [Aphelenchoides besseyi]|nr:hypothetical protein M3Y98_00354300 [Aphelenchoides besseyi]
MPDGCLFLMRGNQKVSPFLTLNWIPVDSDGNLSFVMLKHMKVEILIEQRTRHCRQYTPFWHGQTTGQKFHGCCRSWKLFDLNRTRYFANLDIQTYHQEYKDAENRFYYDGRSTLCSINKINKLVILLQLKRDQLVASTPGNCGR